MTKKVICLISRSIYPMPMSSHTQNMHTFEGWSRFWDTILVLSQSKANKVQESHFKKIHGVFIPLINNKYLNVLYFTFLGIFQIMKLSKKISLDIDITFPTNLSIALCLPISSPINNKLPFLSNKPQA